MEDKPSALSQNVIGNTPTEILEIRITGGIVGFLVASSGDGRLAAISR
jgi:hypothetical protein